MVHKINPYPARMCDRSPPYYVFSKDAILGNVPSISSEVLGLSMVNLTFMTTFLQYTYMFSGRLYKSFGQKRPVKTFCLPSNV